MHEMTSDMELTPPRLRFSILAEKKKMVAFSQLALGERGGTACFLSYI
ncbi:hypothetical protein [Phyllobacterium myrsinacearum]|uniref:Uncharacterized protein n=1 Tax=Phyllobacterium myrsinacearum TaxID=28101 RepID=A0A839EQL0_9HYPH|nr:hypothetical protein [Phyllobacterium myrsinacearum]MBA8881189.1 hypothetical protein [Phyllobacterium myrsinacearum]